MKAANSNEFYVVDCCPKLSCISAHKVIIYFLSTTVCHMIDILSLTELLLALHSLDIAYMVMVPPWTPIQS